MLTQLNGIIYELFAFTVVQFQFTDEVNSFMSTTPFALKKVVTLSHKSDVNVASRKLFPGSFCQ